MSDLLFGGNKTKLQHEVYIWKHLHPSITFIIPNFNSCIDLVITDEPNLVVNCGSDSSLKAKCHYQITYFDINTEYSHPYQQVVWNYKKSKY